MDRGRPGPGRAGAAWVGAISGRRSARRWANGGAAQSPPQMALGVPRASRVVCRLHARPRRRRWVCGPCACGCAERVLHSFTHSLSHGLLHWRQLGLARPAVCCRPLIGCAPDAAKTCRSSHPSPTPNPRYPPLPSFPKLLHQPNSDARRPPSCPPSACRRRPLPRPWRGALRCWLLLAPCLSHPTTRRRLPRARLKHDAACRASKKRASRLDQG